MAHNNTNIPEELTLNATDTEMDTQTTHTDDDATHNEHTAPTPDYPSLEIQGPSKVATPSTVTDSTLTTMMQQMLSQLAAMTNTLAQNEKKMTDKLAQNEEKLSGQLAQIQIQQTDRFRELETQFQTQTAAVNNSLEVQTASIIEIQHQLEQQKLDFTQHRAEVEAIVQEKVSGLATEVISNQEHLRRDLVEMNIDLASTKSNLLRVEQQLENSNAQMITERENILVQVREMTQTNCDNIETRNAVFNSELNEKINEIQTNFEKVTDKTTNAVHSVMSQISQVVSVQHQNTQEIQERCNEIAEIRQTLQRLQVPRPGEGLMNGSAGGFTVSEPRTVGPSELPPTSPAATQSGIGESAQYSGNHQTQQNLPFLSELPLPTFDAQRENAKQFIIDLEGYFVLKRVPDHYRMILVARALTGSALNWFRIAITSQMSYELFKTAFLNKFWGASAQYDTRNRINNGKYHPGAGIGLVDYFLKYALLAKKLDPPLADAEFIQLMTAHMPENIRNHMIVARPPTIHDAVSLLTDLQGTAAHPTPARSSPNNDRGRERLQNRPNRHPGEEWAHPQYHHQQWSNNANMRERYHPDVPRGRFPNRTDYWQRGRNSQDVRIQMLDVDTRSRAHNNGNGNNRQRPVRNNTTRRGWNGNNGHHGRQSPVNYNTENTGHQSQSAPPHMRTTVFQNTSANNYSNSDDNTTQNTPNQITTASTSREN